MRSKCLFEKGKTYYAGCQGLQVKFVQELLGNSYVFKIMNDPVWDEFETKVPDDIYQNKTSYLKELKANKIQELEEISDIAL
jgi:hypothetical protein